MRLTGNVKVAAVENQASLYMQLDAVRSNNEAREKPLKGTVDWSEQSVTLFIPEQSVGMVRFGIILYGKGQIWLDNVRLEIVEADNVSQEV